MCCYFDGLVEESPLEEKRYEHVDVVCDQVDDGLQKLKKLFDVSRPSLQPFNIFLRN